jgi:DHA3 family macrolide efflux protein-like MFS transporter
MSTTGSYMSNFALSIWAWEQTGSATTLALINFFFLLASIPATLVSGAIVDRYNRKLLMMLGDAIAALSTLIILGLSLTHSLHIWHLYGLSAISGGFSQIQGLAYSTSITLIVPPHHYARAGSLRSIVHYGSSIFAPALAGSLYPILGLRGILGIDLSTFAIAIATLLIVTLPQPTALTKSESIWQHLSFGFRYIFKKPELFALLGITSLFWFAHDLSGSIYKPTILARSGGDTQVLGIVVAAAGIGGVLGGILTSIWSENQRHLNKLLWGFMGAGICKTIFGFGQSVKVWLPAQFCASLHFPLLSSSENALWLSHVPPSVQGRVFAANSLILQLLSAIASLLGGWLADRIFEPAMRPGTILAAMFGSILGTESGAGMALLYVTAVASLFLIGLSGYAIPALRRLDCPPSPKA